MSRFPIYWVPQRVGSWLPSKADLMDKPVSNLLGSPASGEIIGFILGKVGLPVSNLLGSPASGEIFLLPTVESC